MKGILIGCLTLAATFQLQAASTRLLLIGDATGGESKTIETILEASGLFDVDVVAASGDASFQPQFDKYKAVIMNYGGDAWPDSARASFERYVQNGGGLVVTRTGASAFPQWAEYNAMTGVGWGEKRDEKAGPYWFYQEGQIRFDNMTAGPAGKALDAKAPYPITIRNTEQPITKGLPLIWLHPPDQILGHLRGPGKNMTILATAHSDAEAGGTNADEIQLLTVGYGKGRVFETLLGGTPDGLRCAGFITTLVRGAEWAATGKVTQRVPADFPTDEKPSLRK